MDVGARGFVSCAGMFDTVSRVLRLVSQTTLLRKKWQKRFLRGYTGAEGSERDCRGEYVVEIFH